MFTQRETLVIDLEARTVAAGPWAATLDSNRPSPEEILARYLALVYEMRGLEPGTEIPLRSLDISVLARATAMPAIDVEDRLVVLMQPGNRRLNAMRRLVRNRRVVVTGAVAVAATAVGLLILVPGGDAAPQEPASADHDGVEFAPHPIEPEIGDALTIER